jgi:hypothetical protein
MKDTHWIGGWVDPRTGLDDMQKRKFLTLPGIKLLHLVVQPVARRYTYYAIPAYVHFKMAIRDNSIGIATAYRLDGRGSILGREKRHFSSPQHPNPLWGQPNFPISRYRGLVKLTTNPHLASRSRIVELYLYSSYLLKACYLIN